MNKRVMLPVYIVLLLIIFILISGYELGGRFYWDESVYADIAMHPLSSNFYDGGIDVFLRHPPLFFVMQGIIAKITTSYEYSFRMASIVYFVVGLIFIVLLIYRLISEGKSIATRDVRSLFFYMRKIHPYLNGKKFSWDKYGIFEIRVKNNMLYELKRVLKLKPDFVIIESFFDFTREWTGFFLKHGYRIYRRYKYSLLLHRKI